MNKHVARAAFVLAILLGLGIIFMALLYFVPRAPAADMAGGAIGSSISLPLSPANGGSGTGTGAPYARRYFGDGTDGAGPASGALAATYIKMFSSWTCTGAVTFSQGQIIYSQGAVKLNTGCSVQRATGNSTTGDYGGAGGSGGSGSSGLNSSQASSVTYSGSTLSTGGAASSNSTGASPTALSAAQIRGLWLWGPPQIDTFINTITGGGAGSAGGNTGGAAGNGGYSLEIIAPTISIASGVLLDTSGFPGVAPTAANKGGGGGGGGAPIILAAQTITDSGGLYRYEGGPPGMCTQPSLQLIGGCDNGVNGCGTGGRLTVTGLTTGGLDATKISITAGSGYQTVPTVVVNAGSSGLTGSPAAHVTLSAGAIATVVVDTAGSGGTFASEATCFAGADGANAFMKELMIQ